MIDVGAFGSVSAQEEVREARRILHCIPNMLNGGAQRQLVLLAAEQRKAGMDVHVALVHSGPNARDLEATGARLHWIATAFSHDPRLLLRLARVIREVRPDIVQSWLTQMDIVVGGAARFTGTPWVLTERSTAECYPSSMKHRARAWLAGASDAVVANSSAGARYWQGQLKGKTPCFVVGNALPLADIRAAAPVSPDEIDLPPGSKMVLHVGRFSPEKNVGVLLRALAASWQEAPLVAYFCGDGTHEAEFREVLNEIGSGGRVRVLGYRSDVFRLMKRADLFVSVSLFEGHPNAVLEAAACGCPMVLSDIPSHREAAGDEGALFVKGDSVLDVARGIVEGVRSPEDALRRAAFAQGAVASLAPARMAEGYAGIYAGVLARHARRAAA